MLKRIFAALLALALCLALCAPSLAEEADPTIAEGYTEEGEGYRSVVTWLKNGELNIFGKFYYPADFDESRQYPTIIMCHGMTVTSSVYEKGQWPMKMAQAGYVSYIFDFCGGCAKSLSDLTPMETSGETMLSDIAAVTEYVKAQPWCNADKVFIMGQSRGGILAAMAAGRNPDEYAGAILLYPAFKMIDNLRADYPDPEAVGETVVSNKEEFGRNYLTDVYDWDVPGTCSQYKGNVLIIHGMADPTVNYQDSVDALANYYAGSESELVLVAGKQSVHAFDVFWQPGQKMAWNAALNYMETEVAREVEAKD